MLGHCAFLNTVSGDSASGSPKLYQNKSCRYQALAFKKAQP
jgi:hypothetical protein